MHYILAPAERYVRDEINPKIRLKPIHLACYYYPQEKK